MDAADPQLKDTLPIYPAPSDLPAGLLVFGRFRLVRPLGRGGMGIVMLARDEELEEEVALKFVSDLVRWNAAAMGQLREEAKRARRLNHPHIVRTYELFHDDRHAAIAMEYVAGGSLGDLLAADGKRFCEPREIQSWLSGLCGALDYAHDEARIVHRDIKPTNLLLCAKGAIKITDFGIARSLAESATRFSHFGQGGTLSYMSPQQLMGENPSPADDIYALGATLYELLTGKPPFYSGHLVSQIERRHPDSLAGRRRALGHSGERVPRIWEELIAACLEKDPAQRPTRAGEVAEALLRNRRKRPSLSKDFFDRRLLMTREGRWGTVIGVAAAAAVIAMLPTSPVAPQLFVPTPNVPNSGFGSGVMETAFVVRPSTGRYAWNADLNRAAEEEFGPGARLADIRDVGRLLWGRLATFNRLFDETSEPHFFVSMDGHRFHGKDGHFFSTTDFGNFGPGFVRVDGLPPPDPKVLFYGGRMEALPFLAVIPEPPESVWRIADRVQFGAFPLREGWNFTPVGGWEIDRETERLIATAGEEGFEVSRVLAMRENNEQLSVAWHGNVNASPTQSFRISFSAANERSGIISLTLQPAEGGIPGLEVLFSREDTEPTSPHVRRGTHANQPIDEAHFLIIFRDHRWELQIRDGRNAEFIYGAAGAIPDVQLGDLEAFSLYVIPGDDDDVWLQFISVESS